MAEFDELSRAVIGDFVGVPGNEGHHMLVVRRLESGESVDLVDGQGLRVRCRVCDRAKSQDLSALCQDAGSDGAKIWLEVCEAIRAEKAGFSLTLVQALAKGGRDEQAIEIATELGVDRVVAWQADRSIVRWNAQKAQKQLERWQKILVAAAKQSRRAAFPTLLGWMDSQELTKWIQNRTQRGALALICHEEATEPLTKILRTELNELVERTELTEPAAGEPVEIILVVGPEGGISETEMEGFCSAEARPVSLGKRILRSSTAGAVALAVIATWMGEM